MLNHYRSPYPNYIHQLFITPSKHLYVLKDKRLKWQSKALERTHRRKSERRYYKNQRGENGSNHRLLR